MFMNPHEIPSGFDGMWLKANFHAHAGEADSKLAAEAVVEAYKAAGYDVLSITNQYVLSDLSGIGASKDITVINGIEYVTDKDMLCIGIQKYIDGSRDAVTAECIRQDGFVVLCHPNYLHEDWWPVGDMMKLQGFTGIEIYNPLIYGIQGSGLAVDAWDHLLSAGKLVWGFANDDFHTWNDLGKAWNMVCSASKEAADIIKAVEGGRFYASSGLVLNDFRCEGNDLFVSAGFINGHMPDLRYTFIGKSGAILYEDIGKNGTYKAAGHEPYIRIEITSRSGEMLWTQPLYQKDFFHL